MQIVIDIPEEVLNSIKTFKGKFICENGYDLIQGIKNSTLLPKGHGDLIDRDALRESMNGVCMGVMAGSDDYDAPLKTLDSATVVIEADKEK